VFRLWQWKRYHTFADDKQAVVMPRSLQQSFVDYVRATISPLVSRKVRDVPRVAGDCPDRPLHLVIFVITIGVNVPRNNEIKAAGDIDQMTDPWCAGAVRRGHVGQGGTTYGHSPQSRSACSPGHLSRPDRRSDTDSFLTKRRAMPMIAFAVHGWPLAS
jgi:hypothetical protein